MDDRDFKAAAASILASESWKQDGFRLAFRPFFYRAEASDGLQNVHTPFPLCRDVVRKITETVNLKTARVCVLYNLEFVDILVKEFEVPTKNITFFPDSEQEGMAARIVYGVRIADPVLLDDKNEPIMPKFEKEFDIVIMNPPYHIPITTIGGGGSSAHGRTLWDKYVELSIKLVKDDGYICNIHPPRWRKPDDKTGQLLSKFKIHYLEIHNSNDGRKVFGKGTRYDWYIIQKSLCNGTKATIRDEEGNIHKIGLHGMPFIPNFDFEKIAPLIVKNGEKHCQIIFSNECRMDKAHMKAEKSAKNIHPCVHLCSKTEHVFWYSSKIFNFFYTPKVIFSDAGSISNAIIDMEGKYGMTSQCMAIPISSLEDGLAIKKVLESKAFDRIIKACRWSNFRIDWRLFRCLRHDFWKQFIP